MPTMKKLSKKSFTNNEKRCNSKLRLFFFAMRRKSCIFAAKYAENNGCIICKKQKKCIQRQWGAKIGAPFVCLACMSEHFMPSWWVLYAFFMAIPKLLKTNRVHKIVCKVHKTLIYNTIIV